MRSFLKLPCQAARALCGMNRGERMHLQRPYIVRSGCHRWPCLWLLSAGLAAVGAGLPALYVNLAARHVVSTLTALCLLYGTGLMIRDGYVALDQSGQPQQGHMLPREWNAVPNLWAFIFSRCACQRGFVS